MDRRITVLSIRLGAPAAAVCTGLLVLVLALSACGPAVLPPTDVPYPVRGGTYVGLSKGAAVARARASGKRWRVVEEDGTPFAVTKDYRPERLNFTIRGGTVVGVTQG